MWSSSCALPFSKEPRRSRLADDSSQGPARQGRVLPHGPSSSCWPRRDGVPTNPSRAWHPSVLRAGATCRLPMDHRVGVFHALPIGAAMLLDRGDDLGVRGFSSPVTLELQQDLEGGHGHGAACSMRRMAAAWAVGLVPPEASSTAYTSYPASRALIAGKARQTSVHRAAMTSFVRPVFSTAATNAASSHEFMLERSMGSWPGKRSRSWGHMGPEKLLVSTVVRMVGTWKIFAALASSSVLFTRACRSMLATPNVIWGWWSMKITALFGE